MFKSNRYTILIVGLLIATPFFLESCDTTLTDRQHYKNSFYSIYGYLDASVDTQWVRVMPIRDSLFFSPKPIDAKVTLEDVNSGQATEMHDSLIAYAHGRYAHNFWTTMDLLPARTYRITARKSGDGNQFSSVEMKLPEDYPTPLVQVANPGPGYTLPDVIYIDGVKRLAQVTTIYLVQVAPSDTAVISFQHIQDSVRTPAGELRVVYPHNYDENRLKALYGGGRFVPPIFKKQIFIASAGPGWHNFGMLDRNFVTSPKGISNVKNGVGYAVGTVGKTIPYKSCYDDIMELIPCPLEKRMRDEGFDF